MNRERFSEMTWLAWFGASAMLVGGLGLFIIGARAERLPISLFAVVLGIALGRVSRNRAIVFGAKVASRWFLRVGIVLIALRLSLAEVREAGLAALLLVVLSILAGFSIALLLARSGGLNLRLSLLLAAGTAICGNSAIIAAGPVVDADEDDVAMAIAAITVYGTLALLVFPAIGGLLGMDQDSFGRWVGTAINDTSQVIGAGFAFGDTAGETATLVKLTRNVFILPLLIGLSILRARWRSVPLSKTRFARLRDAIPGFVLAFVVVLLANSIITVPEALLQLGADGSTVLIMSALIGIGVGASRVSIGRSGMTPLVVGMLAGVILAVVSFGLLALGMGS
jgi:uncharacterized integral membrane protein (TIGR00698 family)